MPYWLSKHWRKRRGVLPLAGVAASLLLLLALFGEGIARPAAAAPVFMLPWEAGQRMFVFQGQDQDTHAAVYSKYAYDFAPAPSGDERFSVRASRAGRVLEVEEDYPISPNCDPTYANQGNYVILDHGDGLGSLYMHLAPQSAIPTEGAWVQAGEALGLTSKTGFVCGSPHLHFTVMELPSRYSVDVPFSDPDSLKDGGRPRTGLWYVSANILGRYVITLPFTPRRAASMTGPGRQVISIPQPSAVAP